MVTSGMLWPMIGLIAAVDVLAQARPQHDHARQRAQPPTECTSVEPAKSWKPMSFSQPPPHFQEPTIG
jgi:hypothetical protein